MTPSHYQVLIPVSRGYPCVRGRLPTRYSPVRRYPLHQSTEVSINRFPLDLHVLGTPPAFILSQDQTLKKMLSQLFRVKIKFELLNSFWTSCVLFRFAKLLFFGIVRECHLPDCRLYSLYFFFEFWEINLMISSTQFLHYVVFKVRVPFDAEHLRLYASHPYLSTTF